MARILNSLHRIAGRSRNWLSPCALVLLYHRIADGRCDPFGLAVSPKNFSEQMAVLANMGCAVPLRQLNEGKIRRPTVVLTFDDGYADNYLSAKPVLERFGIPATFFVTTVYIGTDREFWWDDLARVLLAPGFLPATLRATAGRKEYLWELTNSTNYSAESAVTYAGWRFGQPALTSRHRLFLRMHADLRLLAHAERRDILDQLLQQAGLPGKARQAYRPMTETELAELALSPVADIGSHTVTHPQLSSLHQSQQRFEITSSLNVLQNILGRPVRTFSYPYGSRSDYTSETTTLLRDTGLQLACAAFEGTVRTAFDRFQIPRTYIRDWDGDEFARHLRERLYG